MTRKITVLTSYKSDKVKKLSDAFKQDPYEARILFTSEHFASDCCTQKIIKEEYFTTDGKKVDSHFRIYSKRTNHGISQDLRLFSDSVITNEFGFKNGRFYKKKNPAYITSDFELVSLERSRSISIGSEKTSSSSTPSNELSLHDILFNDNYNVSNNNIFVREWLTTFPWMIFMIEHDINIDLPLNTIIENKLTTLKKALLFKYNVPYPASKKIHEAFRMHHYCKIENDEDFNGEFMGNVVDKAIHLLSVRRHDYSTFNDEQKARFIPVKHNFFTLFGRILTKKENFNVEWLFNKIKEDNIAWNVCTLGILMDRLVDCGWSDRKLMDINNKWSKEYAAILYKNKDRELLVSKVFVEFSQRYELPYIKNLSGLAYEGFRRHHCVGGYEHNVSGGESCIYQMGDYTLQLHFGGLSEEFDLYHLKRNSGVSRGYFTGYSNCDPSPELNKKVEKMIIDFNRHLFTIPLEEYLSFKEDVLNGQERFHSKYPEIFDYMLDVSVDEPAHREPVPHDDATAMEIDYTATGENTPVGLTDNVLARYAGRMVNPDYYATLGIPRELGVESFEVNLSIDEIDLTDGEVPQNNVATMEGDITRGLSEILEDDQTNGELRLEMAAVFGELNEGDEITIEDDGGFVSNLQIRDGRLEHETNVVRLTRAGIEEPAIGIDTIRLEESCMKAEMKEEISFIDHLRKVLDIHCAVTDDEDGIINWDKDGIECVREMFDKLIDGVLEDGFCPYDFVGHNVDLISKAVDSLPIVDEDTMLEMMQGVEFKIQMHKNPYYDLLDALRNEN